MKVRVALAVLLGLFALLTIADRFALLELLVSRAGAPLLFALAQAIAMIGIGCIVRGSREADPALDYLIGFPLFGALLFLIGLLQISVWTIAPLLLVCGLAGVVLILAGWKHNEREIPTSSLSLIAVLVVLICGLVTALAPPTSLEEVASTLAVPRTWALEGRAVELPLLAHSYFPLGLESADVAPLAILGALKGGVASHLLHLFAAIAAALLLYRRTESWFLTAAIVTTPALAIVAGWSFGDWPLVGLFVATFVSLERDDVRTASAATAAGLLTSYIFLPFALLAWIAKRKRPHWMVVFGLLFFVRNTILTGNPIAPFFTGGAPALFGARELALADYVFHADFISESLGVALLALPFFAAGAIAIGAAALAVAAFLLAPSARVLVPFLVIPSMTAKPALQRKLIAVLTAVAIVAQTLLAGWFMARGESFALLTASTSTDAYLRKQRPDQASIAWLNETIPAASRTLVIGIRELYWFEHRVRGGDAQSISHYLDLATEDAVRERLRKDGITHVAVITPEHPVALEPNAQKLLAGTLDHYAVTVTTRGNATLFTLR
ncbi:MAG TPA: hypothetical protein VHW00_03345 [Thermoanaerobaculia bacterium]|nr:hypothetical protein [Thermoanaerobaculia bacterium]